MENTQEQDDLLNTARRNFNIAEDYYASQRAQAAEDFRFRMGNQWDEITRQRREEDNKPVFEINKLGQFVKQVVNSQKENRPQINVKAGDAKSDKKIANVLQAIILKIQEQSFAEKAYDCAFDNACTGGEGFIRIATDYIDSMSFDQDILIKPIENSFSVYIDPNTCADYTNMKWAFVFDKITKEEFEELYPNSDCYTGGLFTDTYDNSGWINTNEVRIAEYFYIENKNVDLVQLEDGTVLEKNIYNKMPNKDDFVVVNKRKSISKSVKYIKTNGYEILEEGDFPCAYIPIIPVYGDTYIVQGKRVMEGIIRQAKSPQRAYNYWASLEAELLMLAPKAPYMVVKGQIAGFEADWANSNIDNAPYLQYNLVTQDGQVAPPPQRQQFDPAINTVLQAKQASNEDIKSTTGIYDPSLGKEMKEASGVALLTKQRQSETNNFMYVDNLSTSLKHVGRCLLDMIPKIYDNERVLSLVLDNKKGNEIVKLNSEDEESIFLNMGKYEASISIGPYGQNQRQEAIESIMSLISYKPELIDLIGDIYIGKQDWEGAQEMSERMKLLLPPALQDGAQKELPPEVQTMIAQGEQQLQVQTQQLAEQQAMIANLTATLNDINNKLKNKDAERESKERIKFAEINRDLIIAGLKEDAQDSRMAFKEELKYSNMKQKEKDEDVVMSDEFVLAGVNDPITEADKSQQEREESDSISDEDKQRLLGELDNYIDSPVNTNPGKSRTFTK